MKNGFKQFFHNLNLTEIKEHNIPNIITRDIDVKEHLKIQFYTLY